MLARFGFIPYLTVFQSRLGLLGVVSQCAGEQAQQRVQLIRRVTRELFTQKAVSRMDSAWPLVVDYLNKKSQLTKNAKKTGPYKGLRLAAGGEIVDVAGKPVYDLMVNQADLWMADASTRSTIGAPTEPNLEEYCNLAVTFGLLSENNNNVRPLGRASVLLKNFASCASSPFALGLEAVILLRSIIASDAAVMHPFVEGLSVLGSEFTRDHAASLLPDLYLVALEKLRSRRAPSEILRECKKAIEPVVSAGARRVQLQDSGKTESLGVLEHRTSPRLEWLVDLGVLEKPIGERNTFVYRPSSDLAVLRTAFTESNGDSPLLYAEECARRYFQHACFFQRVRNRVSVNPLTTAIGIAYRLLRRPVGPVALRDLSLCASLFARNSISVTEVEASVRESGRSDARIRLSGDRFSRDAANVIIDASLVCEWAP